MGFGVPILAVPLPKDGLARHLAFPWSLDTLRKIGVQVMFDAAAPPQSRMPSWERVMQELHAVAGERQTRRWWHGRPQGDRPANRLGMLSPWTVPGWPSGLVGRSESWLSQVERGQRTVDNHTVITALADILGLPVTELTAKEDERDGAARQHRLSGKR
ncbi:helix-turn-helix domain-containing protein [Nonomuraea sp. NPDC004702]